MGLAYKRMYIDIPSEQHAEFKKHAAESGKSMSELIRELIARELHEVREANPPAKRKTKRSK